jgi:hypothetical protein
VHQEEPLSSLCRFIVCVACLLGSAAGLAQTVVAPPVPSRGELLYTTHCITCHSAQIHWRDARLATDWASLRAQVRRWQGNAELGWSEGDVDDVTRYLNQRHYGFPAAGRASVAGGRLSAALPHQVRTPPVSRWTKSERG